MFVWFFSPEMFIHTPERTRQREQRKLVWRLGHKLVPFFLAALLSVSKIRSGLSNLIPMC